jgi:hypothetical protein
MNMVLVCWALNEHSAVLYGVLACWALNEHCQRWALSAGLSMRMSWIMRHKTLRMQKRGTILWFSLPWWNASLLHKQ